MMTIIRLYPLHHPLTKLSDKPRHIGETVFDSSLHPAQVALLQSLHQLCKPKGNRPSWSQRMAQWYKRSRQ
ncbi:hypothetical protein FHU10_0616 [Serratia fonticola]|uniref:Uncharacterized protein n=1 Tax=Serratia fonticola TaxID=47917 RepID=A0A542BL52_SERFO|nr:hypothetical protein [Serratia fonticola]TQI79312.1 hypothetical protein FHU09_1833 [Serratia fonticola]TQI98663.1 hypothetical protein FHU11_4215 [Serratia fonticola]TVZ68190.1 hypothetical protein FHU10_0616 [Serratia fonticola]